MSVRIRMDDFSVRRINSSLDGPDPSRFVTTRSVTTRYDLIRHDSLRPNPSQFVANRSVTTRYYLVRHDSLRYRMPLYAILLLVCEVYFRCERQDLGSDHTNTFIYVIVNFLYPLEPNPLQTEPPKDRFLEFLLFEENSGCYLGQAFQRSLHKLS